MGATAVQSRWASGDPVLIEGVEYRLSQSEVLYGSSLKSKNVCLGWYRARLRILEFYSSEQADLARLFTLQRIRALGGSEHE